MALLGAILFIVFWVVVIYAFGKMMIDAQRSMAERTEYIKRIADALEKITQQLDDRKYKGKAK